MKCKKCENIHRDPLTGITMCLTCGSVIEESNIVQGIEFDSNQNAQGTFIDSSKPTYFNPSGRNTLSQMIDPTQLRLNKVYKYMSQVANALAIPTCVVDRAKKFYNIASNKKFTQGRKTKQIVAAILYLACRWDCTKHLLIDFSEVLQINLFVIGSAYLKLVKLLSIEIKIIDPSLYMHRFCNKLNFGGKAREIENTALKILQFLKRDWITTGRRPSGLCGACLYIAAKLHGFLITIDEVAEVVHVCNETIRKRINEFSLTDVATMSKEEFEQFEQTTYYSGKNPPAFTRNRHQETEEQKDEEYNENEDVKETQNNNNSNNLANGIFGSISKDGFKIPINFPKVKSIKSETDLSMLNEKDELNYLYNEKEYIVRKHIWDVMYKDWLDEQKEKKMYEKPLQLEPKKIRSRKVSSALSQDSIKTPYEAIKSSGKFGKKINFNYVKSLFQG